MEVERVQGMAEGRGRADEAAVDEPEDADRGALELVVAVDPRQLQQDEGEHRVARGSRLVLEVLLAGDELSPSAGER